MGSKVKVRVVAIRISDLIRPFPPRLAAPRGYFSCNCIDSTMRCLPLPTNLPIFSSLRCRRTLELELVVRGTVRFHHLSAAAEAPPHPLRGPPPRAQGKVTPRRAERHCSVPLSSGPSSTNRSRLPSRPNEGGDPSSES